MNSLYSPAKAGGSPIQKSPDQSQLGDSPKLIAAYHVFHRLLVPRHPPCALSSLHSPSTLHLATFLFRKTPNAELKKENYLHEFSN